MSLFRGGFLAAVVAAAITCCHGDRWPPRWSEVPRDLADFPLVANTTVIDPWNYLHRQGLYSLMLEHTRDVMAGFGPDNEGNILWGLPIQHGWQFESGRLINFPHESITNCPDPADVLCISVTSWWASMNYFLSVVPFIGAMEAGYFDYWPHKIELLKPDILSNGLDDVPEITEIKDLYCVTAEECMKTAKQSTTSWTEFFQYVLQVQEGVVAIGRTKFKDGLLKYMWRAHVDSVNDGLRPVAGWLSLLSSPESQFAVSWANCMEFLAATRWDTNKPLTYEYQDPYLPKRVLNEEDTPPHIEDLHKDINTALVIFNALDAANSATNGAVLAVWKRANCSPPGRKYAREIIMNIVHDPAKALRAALGLLKCLLFYPCVDWVSQGIGYGI